MRYVVRNLFISIVLFSYFLLSLTWVFGLDYDDGGFGSFLFFAGYLLSFIRLFIRIFFYDASYFEDISPHLGVVLIFVIEICVALLLDFILRCLYRKIIQFKRQHSTRK